ncbi:unnamed protein product [Nippostrongylus brasiliensis]|uniref:Secreted protein n=1 Tax=Nippostrongylus brasiliensis TaxID=27835 RepID=A0A0N4YP68_NIPBR|nr:unnamed protein product [Nippostrongylus brasiliensis]
MRLKRIDLVLVALCTHVAYADQGWSDFLDTNANVATMGPLSCAHDGYNSGDSCVCKPYFSKSSCTQRTSAILTDSTDNVDSCVARAKEICNPPSSCDPNSLSLANLDALIDQSQGNSQVHVIALAPTNIIADSDFNVRPDYEALRSIADATLGFFVTPYSGFTRGLLGVTTVSQVISNIFDLIVNSVETVSVKPIASAPNMRYNVGQEKFYLSFRSLGNARTIFYRFLYS